MTIYVLKVSTRTSPGTRVYGSIHEATPPIFPQSSSGRLRTPRKMFEPQAAPLALDRSSQAGDDIPSPILYFEGEVRAPEEGVLPW